MGKEKPGFLTPKAIANRIKSKGLQKLRWYCQMCQKQCRDENGFKCHTMSESHQRQLLLFGENSNKFMDEFSAEFHREYLNSLRRRFGTKRVSANLVYQEYINDRNHIHMNATRWLTLTDYVQWLGKKGICVVDETEKGWFVTYIDRDPETLRRQEEVEKKRKLDLDDRQRQELFLQRQMDKAKEKATDGGDAAGEAPSTSSATELKKSSEDELVRMSFKRTKLMPTSETATPSGAAESASSVFKMPQPVAPVASSSVFSSTSSSTSSLSDKSSSKKSALDEIMSSEEAKREKQNRKDHWLHKNIVVKITTSKLGEKFNKKKAIVTEVVDLYGAVVRLVGQTDKAAVCQLDQSHVETVLPAIGKHVRVVNGAYRGELATLDKINESAFNARIVIAAGPLKGRVVDNVQYDDICKVHEENE